MINEQNKQRIEKEAEGYTVSVESGGCSFWQGMYRGYVAGATAEYELLTPQLEYANSTIEKFSAELERSEKLLQEYRELLKLADLALSTVRTEPTMDGSVLGAFDRRLFISRLADFYDAHQKLHQPNRAI